MKRRKQMRLIYHSVKNWCLHSQEKKNFNCEIIMFFFVKSVDFNHTPAFNGSSFYSFSRDE